jgi:Ni/Co efflux regulator RcnB/quercetin dioxygenase-like cupin family protein
MSQRRRLITGVALWVTVMAAASFETAVLAQADRDLAPREPQGRSRVAVRGDQCSRPDRPGAARSRLRAQRMDVAAHSWRSGHQSPARRGNHVATRRDGSCVQGGQSWTDSTSQVHAAGNTGSGKARLLTNFLLPKGAPQITVVQESQFGPAITYEAKFPLPSLATETEIVQRVIDLPPGWRTERAYHGFAARLIMQGEVTYRIGPHRKSYKPGDAWMAQAGTLVTEENNTPKRARVFRSYLVRKGATP